MEEVVIKLHVSQMSDVVRVLQATGSRHNYVTNCKARSSMLNSTKTVIGSCRWRPELHGPLGPDLQAHTSVQRLLFFTEVTQPEVMASSPTTVILEHVCIVYSTAREQRKIIGNVETDLRELH